MHTYSVYVNHKIHHFSTKGTYIAITDHYNYYLLVDLLAECQFGYPPLECLQVKINDTLIITAGKKFSVKIIHVGKDL